jgi:hypothetical protein
MQIGLAVQQLEEAPQDFAFILDHIVYHGLQRNNLQYLVQVLKLNIEL